MARRYDGWADWPADETNSRAVETARAGMFNIHTCYDVVRLNDPSNTVWTRGTSIFVLTRAAIQARVEEAYHRPPNDHQMELSLTRPKGRCSVKNQKCEV